MSPGKGDPSGSWQLTPEDRALVCAKHPANRLGFAALLLFYRAHGRFPRAASEIDLGRLTPIADELGVAPSTAISERSWKRYRAEIRALLGGRETSVADSEALVAWLAMHAVAATRDHDGLRAALEARCAELDLEPPAAERAERLIRAAVHAYDERLHATVHDRLTERARAGLDALLEQHADRHEHGSGPPADGRGAAIITWLKADPGRPSLNSLCEEMAKLELIRKIGLPDDLFEGTPPKEIERCRRRVAVEAAYELRRHPEAARRAWVAAFVYARARAITDGLVDLLLETVHQIGARAERRIERELIDDLKRVSGKPTLLFDIADASLGKPDGTVREVIFPVVGEQTLKDLVRERRATGPAYRVTLRTVIRNAYRGHYRRMLPQLLETLTFRSNNVLHRPVIEALELVRRYAGTRVRTFPPDETPPLDDVVKGLWRGAVLETDPQGRTRVNRISYEICVLEALRERVRCKEIWVVGADRYRNPDEDVPTDFAEQRSAYYASLGLPMDAARFVDQLRDEMRLALAELDRGLPRNPHVRIRQRGGGRITVTPLEAQPEPVNLRALKGEIQATWPMTRLLDMLKEADLRLDFTDAFKSPTTYEAVDRTTLRSRLLLCLHGLGTNAGLQRMAGGDSKTSYKDLLYVRQRYVTVDGLRQAIATVVNGTLRARNPEIWGEATTACASDSKHFGAWDQNLTTQWHARYGGRGVMIYWHVERKSLCIHSQLKSPSSSEVASMIEGVVRHCTEMEVDRQYVDSHGQSEVAFAFCRLLGFQLLPRLKRIHVQRLYRPDSGFACSSLEPVMTRPIDWHLIAQQYDEMVKYATAVRIGSADTEAILRRFTRNNRQHPTYKAFAELGKAVKTIFLCRYLHRRELQREIEGGLNIIEHWNGANDFVFFARRGELVSNRRDHHEVAMLALHLLQNCMVYINTLMIQRVLDRPQWTNRLTMPDLRALTPLVWEHVNPYGRFELDMSQRIPLD